MPTLQAEMARIHYENLIKAKNEYTAAKLTYESFNDTFAAIITNEYVTYCDGSTHKPTGGFDV